MTPNQDTLSTRFVSVLLACLLAAGPAIAANDEAVDPASTVNLLSTGEAAAPVPALPVVATPVPAAPVAAPAVASEPKRADFLNESFSKDARHVADWVVDSGDNKNLPFAIVDKVAAKVFVFDKAGRLRGAAPALLGLAKGDHSVPGIGEREMSSIRVQDRTTPAGRFVVSMGVNYGGKDILWVDYAAAVSMHRVINTKPLERRPHRLTTPTPLDNRISYGCINVPVKFFDTVVSPSFSGTWGVVYVLPEVSSVREVFSSYDVAEPSRNRFAQSAPMPAAQ